MFTNYSCYIQWNKTVYQLRDMGWGTEFTFILINTHPRFRKIFKLPSYQSYKTFISLATWKQEGNVSLRNV